MKITDRLFELQDKEYAAFQAKLTPGVPLETFIGVRVPKCHALAKELYKAGDAETQRALSKFLEKLPHKYYDENMLHGSIISEVKEYDKAIEMVEAFLPYVDNWAVCDTMKPKAFKKNTDLLIKKIKVWVKSKHVYTCRFGIEMLMNFYLDDKFDGEFLKIVAGVKSEEYYVNMMIAWYFATALAKQWDATIGVIESGVLGNWVHNKTIQKARESYRIAEEQKAYLLGLKR